jgi:hypothetical protein
MALNGGPARLSLQPVSEVRCGNCPERLDRAEPPPSKVVPAQHYACNGPDAGDAVLRCYILP